VQTCALPICPRTMSPFRMSAVRGAGRRRTVLAATGLVAALALTATACGGSSGDEAGGRAGSGASRAADDTDGKVSLPSDLTDRLEEHGIDVDRWKDGGW